MENFLGNNDVNNGIKQLKKAQKLLLKLEKKAQNRQVHILLKIKKQLIELNYIELTIEKNRLECDLGQERSKIFITDLDEWVNNIII